MALLPVLTSLDGIADPIKSEYTEKDGKFYLQVTPKDGFELDDVSGLKTALSRERGTRERLEREIKKFEGIDPEKAATLQQELDELKAIDPTKEADKIANTKFESAKSQLVDKYGREIGSLKDREKQLTTVIDKLMREQQATAAIAAEKGDVELLLPHVLQHTRVKETEGKFSVEVVDGEGNARLADTKGTPMTIVDLIKEMRNHNSYGRAFDADDVSGSGKRTGGGGGGNPPQNKRSQMSADQKGEYIRQYGQDAYLKLPK